MTHEQEMLARAMSHIDDDMILAAHAPRKKVRRLIPYLVAACLVVIVAVAFPYLRAIINTNTDLFGPSDEGGRDDAAIQVPEKYPSYKQNIPVTLEGTTITLTATTETTATFTVVKTNDTPIYAMLYDRLSGALASTEPNYKDNGVLIRPNTLRLYVNGAEQPVFHFPTAPGTYEVVVDFTSIRNGTYPMQEIIGLYAYPAEDEKPVTVRFSLDVVPVGTETESSPESEMPTDTSTVS